MTHVYRWRKYRPEWFGRACRVAARERLRREFLHAELRAIE